MGWVSTVWAAFSCLSPLYIPGCRLRAVCWPIMRSRLTERQSVPRNISAPNVHQHHTRTALDLTEHTGLIMQPNQHTPVSGKLRLTRQQVIHRGTGPDCHKVEQIINACLHESLMHMYFFISQSWKYKRRRVINNTAWLEWARSLNSLPDLSQEIKARSTGISAIAC